MLQWVAGKKYDGSWFSRQHFAFNHYGSELQKRDELHEKQRQLLQTREEDRQRASCRGPCHLRAQGYKVLMGLIEYDEENCRTTHLDLNVQESEESAEEVPRKIGMRKKQQARKPSSAFRVQASRQDVAEVEALASKINELGRVSSMPRRRVVGKQLPQRKATVSVKKVCAGS